MSDLHDEVEAVEERLGKRLDSMERKVDRMIGMHETTRNATMLLARMMGNHLGLDTTELDEMTDHLLLDSRSAPTAADTVSPQIEDAA